MQSFILYLLSLPSQELNSDTFKDIKRHYVKQNNINDIPSNVEIFSVYQEMLNQGIIKKNADLEKVLKKRGIRSESGIVPVQVLTKPFRCPGKCIFCPNDATMPKSYINTEPGAMRALLNNFDPYKQTYNRLLSLTLTGHPTDKIEMIVLGGTRDVYPKDYKIWFIKGLYDACNTFQIFYQKFLDKQIDPKSAKYCIEDIKITYPENIAESIKINENTTQRIIGLTIETRPEYVTDENCQFRRDLGVTRIEMGIQSMFDDVLDANKRGHSIQQVREAMHKLRGYGFKISTHFMTGLYQSTTEKDVKTFELAFNDQRIRPDEIKFYPTGVIPNTELYDHYKKGEYSLMDIPTLKTIIKKILLEYIPPYTRIKRLIRDIPANEVIGNNYVTNLRQLVEEELTKELAENPTMREKLYSRLRPNPVFVEDQEKLFGGIKKKFGKEKDITTFIIDGKIDTTSPRNFVSLCTRSREVRHKKNNDSKTFLVIRKYQSSIGEEFFISYEDQLGYLYGFTRLTLPQQQYTIDYPGLGANTALIRELHVYGKLAKISENNIEKTQHKGIGKILMDIAEQIGSSEGYTTLSVISGVGVKQYYRNIGYTDEGTYVVKKL